MKILYLAHRIPFPPNKGDKIRSFNEVRHLSRQHEVDLLCLADEPGDLKYRLDLEQICGRVAVYPLHKLSAKVRGVAALGLGKSLSVRYFYLSKVQACFDRWVKECDYDAIVCFSSSMAEYLFRSPLLLSANAQTRPKLIMDFCDVDSDKWRQYAVEARFPMNLVYRLENIRLENYERQVWEAFDHSVLISMAEAELFRRICPKATDVKVIPNGVDHEYFAPAAGEAGRSDQALHLVFTGAMDYHANVDGVCWFCREIWPALKQKFTDLRFYIVGSNPTAAVTDLGRLEGVTVTGFVDDIREYYRLADVCVIPLRLARGVQNKVLESMAMGKAVVTTAKANAGIQAADGEHLKVADTAEEFAEAVASLLEGKQQRSVLGQDAREFVVAKYDWADNLEKLEKLLP